MALIASYRIGLDRNGAKLSECAQVGTERMEWVVWNYTDNVQG